MTFHCGLINPLVPSDAIWQGSILTFGITCPVGQVAMQVHLSPTMPYLFLLANNAHEYAICTCPVGRFR